MRMSNTAEAVERGMRCLLDQLGVIETEKFISIIIREKSDYTKWRRTYFGDASVEKINADAIAFAERHPFQPNKPF